MMVLMSDQVTDPMNELLQAVTELSYVMSRKQVHVQMTASGDVKMERAGVALLSILRRREPLRLNELAERLLVRAPHVTRQVSQLEGQGLVERTRDQADHRAQLIRLTERGRTVADQVDRAYYDRLCRTLDDVPIEDVRAATRILHRLVADSLENIRTAQE
ncbi:MarR family transcriptional regulator [Streptomyces sp. NPDC046805]|uniref:MarR family winged helix-turn-helix transcriptional regulator n=1 Tax=Streptomyces sp. NPDC046805 TaxID=3155134 RepID=UPI0033D86CDB